MSEEDVYGHIPDGGASKISSEALKELAKSSSNSINGKVNDSRDSDYPEEKE